jgi:hypothetical protein
MSVLFGWTVVGIAFGILISAGLTFAGILGGNMNLPYEGTIARICFSLGFVFLLARASWWIAFEEPMKGSWPQLFLCTTVIFVSIGCLWAASMKWVSEREVLLQPKQPKQVTANQPLCGIDVRVEPVRDNVKQLTVVIKNGKYVAKDVSLKWSIDVVEGSRSGKPMIKKIASIPEPMTKPPFDILPEQELPVSFVQFTKDDFNNMVRGDKDSLIRVWITIEYRNIDDRKQRYSCTYLITRLADVKEDKYEVTLNSSKLLEL